MSTFVPSAHEHEPEAGVTVVPAAPVVYVTEQSTFSALHAGPDIRNRYAVKTAVRFFNVFM
jgi:hypothetical protein